MDNNVQNNTCLLHIEMYRTMLGHSYSHLTWYWHVYTNETSTHVYTCTCTLVFYVGILFWYTCTCHTVPDVCLEIFNVKTNSSPTNIM